MPQAEFEYSEAAMEQWRASKRRSMRPVLVFLAAMVLVFIVHEHQAAAVTVTIVGMAVALAMILQNYLIGRRAEKRLKEEAVGSQSARTAHWGLTGEVTFD